MGDRVQGAHSLLSREKTLLAADAPRLDRDWGLMCEVDVGDRVEGLRMTGEVGRYRVDSTCVASSSCYIYIVTGTPSDL